MNEGAKLIGKWICWSKMWQVSGKVSRKAQAEAVLHAPTLRQRTFFREQYRRTGTPTQAYRTRDILLS